MCVKFVYEIIVQHERFCATEIEPMEWTMVLASENRHKGNKAPSITLTVQW